MVDNKKMTQPIRRPDETGFVARMVRTFLRSKGYHVVEANNSIEAISSDKQENFNVIVLDLQTISNGGVNHLPELMGTFDPNTPVVLISSLGEGMRAQQTMAPRASASGPMALKPFFPVLPERWENDHHSITLLGENSQSQAVLGDRKIEISTFPFSIGRKSQRENPPNGKHLPANLSPSNHLELPDPRPHRISRRHFQIELRDGRFLVRDMGSRLGVVVNHNFIGGLQLRKTQELRKGDNLLVVGGSDSPHRYIVTV